MARWQLVIVSLGYLALQESMVNSEANIRAHVFGPVNHRFEKKTHGLQDRDAAGLHKRWVKWNHLI